MACLPRRQRGFVILELLLVDIVDAHHAAVAAAVAGQRLLRRLRTRIVGPFLHHHHACRGSAAICLSACSNTSGGCPPEIRCLRSMMIAGTARMPCVWKNRSPMRAS